MNAALRAFRETDWKDNRSLRARVLNVMAARFETASVPFNLRFNAALALTEYGRAAEVDEDSLGHIGGTLMTRFPLERRRRSI